MGNWKIQTYCNKKTMRWFLKASGKGFREGRIDEPLNNRSASIGNEREIARV